MLYTLDRAVAIATATTRQRQDEIMALWRLRKINEALTISTGQVHELFDQIRDK